MDTSHSPHARIPRRDAGSRDPARRRASPSRSRKPRGTDAEPARERVQKYLAHAGVASRRHAEELIAAGAVTINGVVVREPGARVVPGRDEVRVDGRLVRPAPEGEHLYILLNKPVGAVSKIGRAHV